MDMFSADGISGRTFALICLNNNVDQTFFNVKNEKLLYAFDSYVICFSISPFILEDNAKQHFYDLHDVEINSKK